MEDNLETLYWDYLKHIRKTDIQPLLDLGWCVEPNYITRGEFINKLLTDDEFYQKWGNDCCEEVTTREMCEMFGVDYDKVTEWTYSTKNIDRDLEVRTMLTDPGVGPNYPKRKLKEDGN